MTTETKIIHTDQGFIEGLLKNDTIIVREIYSRFSGKIKSYVQQNSGSEEDAGDILQESLVDIFQQAKYKGLQLSCPFEPFLLLIARRKWLNELKKRGRQPVTKGTDDLSVIGDDVFALSDQLEQQQEKEALFMRMFDLLGERCREIIRKCLDKKPQEEVAQEMGVSFAYLRKKKSECMAELIKMVKK